MVALRLLLVCTSIFLTSGHTVIKTNPFTFPRTSTFSPFSVPTDPTANPSTTARLTVYNNTVIASKKGSTSQIKALYDQDSFRSFNMEITQDNLQLLNQDPTQEEKVHCRFTIDYNTPQAKTFSNYGVACSIKGSVGSLRICVDEYHRWNGNCRHLSYRIDANGFHSDNNTEDFYGSHSVSFGGMPVDYAMVSERTSFKLMQDVGIIAPMAVHAKLFLNGKYQGIFSFVQEVDIAFTKMHWKKDHNGGRGTVYKELWLNPLHMQELTKPGRQPEKYDSFMLSVMDAITNCPMTQSSATALFNKYFDVKSLVDGTAFNTLIGDTDDWRLRHNFLWYVREDKQGTKLVFIPWDYDRLDDTGASSRSLGGKVWWDIAGTTGGGVCNSPLLTPAQTAQQMGGSPAMIAYNTDMYNQFPPDLTIPSTCDKMVQLMAIALGPLVRQATLNMAPKINAAKIQGYWNKWNPQIQTAVSLDPAGPSYGQMLSSQTTLQNYFTSSTSKAIRQVRDYSLNPTVVPTDTSISGWLIPASAFKSSLPPPVATSLPPLTARFAPAASSSLPPATSTITFGLPSSTAFNSYTNFFGSLPAVSSFGAAPSFGTTTTLAAAPSFGATTPSFGATSSFGATPSFGVATTSFGTGSFAPAFGTASAPVFGSFSTVGF